MMRAPESHWNPVVTFSLISALDFVELMRGFYADNPMFEGINLYIYGQSYGGKMAVDMALRMREVKLLFYNKKPLFTKKFIKKYY